MTVGKNKRAAHGHNALKLYFLIDKQSFYYFCFHQVVAVCCPFVLFLKCAVLSFFLFSFWTCTCSKVFWMHTQHWTEKLFSVIYTKDTTERETLWKITFWYHIINMESILMEDCFCHGIEKATHNSDFFPLRIASLYIAIQRKKSVYSLYLAIQTL